MAATDGGVFRHQTRQRLDGLLEGFEVIAECQARTTTPSGAPAAAVQVLARNAAD